MGSVDTPQLQRSQLWFFPCQHGLPSDSHAFSQNMLVGQTGSLNLPELSNWCSILGAPSVPRISSRSPVTLTEAQYSPSGNLSSYRA